MCRRFAGSQDGACLWAVIAQRVSGVDVFRSVRSGHRIWVAASRRIGRTDSRAEASREQQLLTGETGADFGAYGVPSE
jgi:hypothetical protein